MEGASEDVRDEWDFFISYTRTDQAWAEWIAWVLEEDGYRVLIQAWDFVPGRNWIAGMQSGIRDAARTVAVVSDAYLSSVYGSAEWQAAIASDPDGTGRKLLVVRVGKCERPGLLAAVVGADIFGVPEDVARQMLRGMVSAAQTGRIKPLVPPLFPGLGRAVPNEPEFPGMVSPRREWDSRTYLDTAIVIPPGSSADVDVPYTGDLDLTAVSSRKALSVMLQIVYVRADRPSFRSLETAAERTMTRLSATVVSRMLKGMIFPRRKVMLAFLRACGISDNYLAPWVRAWERVAVIEFGLVPLDNPSAVLDAAHGEQSKPEPGESVTDMPRLPGGGSPPAEDPANLDQLREEVTKIGAESDPLRRTLSELEQWRVVSDSSTERKADPGGRSATMVMGRYMLIKKLGAGGQGSVWLAEDQLLSRVVALKQLGNFAFLDPDERWARALAEAKAVARVKHPAIPAIYDSFIADDSPWIVMEYIRGRSLDMIIGEHSLEEGTIAKIGLPVLMALNAAHLAGVVHRDVKPANILVTDEGSVFLVDFGIAKILGDTALTGQQGIIGTLEFMAPERLKGLPASPASDLWSLGVTFFYALEGHSPFRINAEGAATAVAAILSGDPPCLVKGGKLAEITRRLLRKDPAQRPNAQEVAMALRSILREP